jgi:DNA-binding MarR family transcriptional regulator
MLAPVQANGGATAHTTSQELAESLLRLWHHLMRGGSKQLYALLDELDLSFSHVKALHALSDLDRAVSVKELAEDLGMSLPGTSRLVDALHRRGFVDRHEDPSDRRTKRIAPTPAGHDAVARIDTARLQSLQSWVQSLSPDQRDGLAAALADLPLDPWDRP